MFNRATSSPDVLGMFVMFKNLTEIPSIVGYRRIILLGSTRPHDVVQRHLTIYTKDIARRSTSLCDGRALNFRFYSWWSHRPLRCLTITYDG